MLAVLTNTTDIDAEAVALTSECEVVMELTRKAVQENASAALDQAAYQQRYEALVARYEAAHARLGEIDAARTERHAKRANINRFLKTLARYTEIVTEFEEDAWYITVDRVKVYQAVRGVPRRRRGGDSTGRTKGGGVTARPAGFPHRGPAGLFCAIAAFNCVRFCLTTGAKGVIIHMKRRGNLRV